MSSMRDENFYPRHPRRPLRLFTALDSNFNPEEDESRTEDQNAMDSSFVTLLHGFLDAKESRARASKTSISFLRALEAPWPFIKSGLDLPIHSETLWTNIDLGFESPG